MSTDMQKVNIKVVAQAANVSTATVSRVMNTPEKVSPKTRDRVLHIIEQMKYTPKTALPSNSNIIAFINDIENPFYNDVIRRLTDYAAKEHYYLISCNTNSNLEIENTMFEYFKKIECAGIILTGLTLLKNLHADIPVILLDSTHLSDTDNHFFNITSDNQCAVQILVDYLVKLNHKKIGFISGGEANSCGKEREHIFISYMKKIGLDVPHDYIFSGNFNIKSGYAAFDYFYSLSNTPTAIIAANDEMAKGFIIRAGNMGVNVPKDISVCGIDAITDDIFLPQITSIHQDADATAREILDYIQNNDKKAFPRQLILPVTFSPGNTCYKLQVHSDQIPARSIDSFSVYDNYYKNRG